ncbi:hypothetical protein HHI36_022350 [Cryptolaemus montrouzieri]|uniref:Orotidine 5'-phosphate decarboxylase domain-containing protein n=1 Tax=Cryptolaemus montrouzieri TaxID=559131 RepID=A0ABD2N0A9_9CUCU
MAKKQTNLCVASDITIAADILNLAEKQGCFQISSWATLGAVRSIFGERVLDAINEVDLDIRKDVFLLAEANASGTLIDEKYTRETLKIASEYDDLIVRIVGQSPLFRDKPGSLQLTPEVRVGETEDNLGQQYNSLEKVIVEKGGNIAVVGREITQSQDMRNEAKKYKDLLWAAYLKRIS